jgi:hypothetical protein
VKAHRIQAGSPCIPVFRAGRQVPRVRIGRTDATEQPRRVRRGRGRPGGHPIVGVIATLEPSIMNRAGRILLLLVLMLALASGWAAEPATTAAASDPPIAAGPHIKTIGVIGGISWVSSAEYYRQLNEGVPVFDSMAIHAEAAVEYALDAPSSR